MSANPLHVKTFFHEQSSTFSYLVRDRESSECVVIDPCLDIDHASCSIAASSADQVSEYISSNGLTCKYILETHAHADHLSAALYLKNKHGGQLVIGDTISLVQSTFAQIYAESEAFPTNGSQFDVLMSDGDQLELSGHVLKAYHVPGHTPACMAYHLDDLLFVGDTLFMPDSGTARCDFPGGDAATLYNSIQRLFALPEHTRVFVCHDYQPGGRKLAFESTIGEQKRCNVHINQAVSQSEFVAMREQRDATLDMPKLIMPSLQVNIRAGALPVHPVTQQPFFTLPINAFGGGDITQIIQKQ